MTIDDLYKGVLAHSAKRNTVCSDHALTNFDKRLISNFEQYLKHANVSDLSYKEYKIPKTTTGYRTISEPNETLKAIQTAIAKQLNDMVHTHDCCYAYVKGRSCKDAIIKHAQKNTKYFYKFDLKDFFTSITADIIKETFKQIYPLCYLSSESVNKLITIACYKTGLPQGSPLSPILSNLIMIPFDYKMYYSIKHFDGVYTRYADDMLISFPKKFEIKFIEKIICKHLKQNNYYSIKLNTDKSRCGSINGSNWNLGLMLNKDRNITLGAKEKKRIKAMLNNFILDFTNGNKWSIIETQSLQGTLNYFANIEHEYQQYVVKHFEKKYNCNIKEMFHNILHAS